MRKTFVALMLSLVLFAGLFGSASASDCYGGYSTSWTYYGSTYYGGRYWPAGLYAHVNGLWYRYGYGYEYGTPACAPAAPAYQLVIPASYAVPTQPAYAVQAPPQLVAPQYVLPPGVLPPQYAPQYAPQAAPGGLSQEDLYKLKLILKDVQLVPQQAAPAPPQAAPPAAPHY